MLTLLKKIPRPSTRAVWLYLGGFACLALTALMNRHAGVSQGATEEGRQLLGAAAIVIDIVGIVVFGSVAGNMFWAGKKFLASMVLIVMIGCALFSITSIMSFVASEWLSVAESRKATIEAGKQRDVAAIHAAKERREAQERLAQSGLGMMQAQLKEANRKEKRVLSEKFSKGTSEMIDALGKEQTAKPADPPSQEIAMRPDGGAEVASWMLSIPEKTWQVTRIAAVAILLIVLKAFAFPLGAYYWSREGARAYATIDVTPTAAMADQQTIPLEAIKPLALPKPVEIKQSQPAPDPMAAEWRAILDGLDFFASRKGPLRPGVARDKIGYHWLAWLMAERRTGEFTSEQVDRLYDEFCSAAHREQVSGINIAKGELRTAGDKAKKKSIQVRDSKSPTLWTINPIPAGRVRETLIKRNLLSPSPEAAAPKTVEAASGSVVPFVSTSGADARPAPAANDDAPVPAPRKPVQGLAELTRHVPDLRAMAALERQEKAAWRAKGQTAARPYLHRFSRARAA